MEKFFIQTNEGKKEVTFYQVAKVTFAELNQMIQREFPGVRPEELQLTLGLVSCTISTK